MKKYTFILKNNVLNYAFYKKRINKLKSDFEPRNRFFFMF